MAHIWKVNQGVNNNYRIKTEWWCTHTDATVQWRNARVLFSFTYADVTRRFVQCNEHLRRRGGDTSVILGILLGNGQMYGIVLPARADVNHLYWLFMQHECSNNKSAGKSAGQMKVWIFLVLLFTRFQIAQLHHLTYDEFFYAKIMCEACLWDCGSDSGVELWYTVDALKLEQDTEPKVGPAAATVKCLKAVDQQCADSSLTLY